MSSEQLTGRTLGDFVVRHQLGEGGYGAVYRAEQPLLGREAVIKVLHDRHRRSKTLLQRFLREARLASKLDHPYAAHIYAFGAEPDGLMWIAMEYVKGQTLHELLRARGPLPLEELVPLLDRICEVLQAAHDLGIVHRDIKPPNVMVIQRAGRAFPKLLDFGIAKLADEDVTPTETADVVHTGLRTPVRTSVTDTPVDDGTVSFIGQPGGVLGGRLAAAHELAHTMKAPVAVHDEPLTEAGAAVGSPPYMAPEQWGDAAATTARTDLYALGVLAYEALAGRRPFTGNTMLAYAVAHATAPVPPLGGTLPAALDAVMQKALAKEPADRYASALELAQAVRSAAGFGSQPLPALDDELRLSVETSFPQPIAESIAAFHAARNPHQGRDALRDIATTAIRYVALIALSARAQVRLAEVGKTTAIAEHVRELRRRPLRDADWLAFARELVEPFRGKPQAHPIPELVALLARDGEADPFAAFVRDRPADPDPLPAIRELLPELTRLLRALSFVADYPLVVVTGDRADSWMGVRRPRRVALELHGRVVEPGHPVLLDAANRPVIVLWPLVQTSSPMPGAPVELFLLDGGGRRGARMVALPNTLERQDDAVWDWLADKFASVDRDTPVSADSLESRPYRGLAAFTARDADAFVGREREIDAAVNRLATSALIAVVGPSGAGKSSFVHAGVVPSLPVAWTALSMRPGATPLATLERKRAGITNRPTVLVVDQFEELFTLCASADERRAFVRALLTPDDNLRIVLTLRDDFLGRATQMPELRERLPAALFLLGTPARADLVRILTQPLAKQGFDFDDPSLPARMVDEVAETPGALALLSFTAAKLWELRDRHFRQLTRKAYDALGGVAGALAQHAETTLAQLSAHEQRLARTAFGHLVTAEGTRASLTHDELDQLLRDPAAGTVIEKLVVARLIVATESEDGDDRLEIIHEALLVAWPRLAEWRRADAEGARSRDQLRAAARQWIERDRPDGLLWRGDALAELQLWRARHRQPLTDSEEAFVTASIAESTRGRRVRRGVIGVVIGLMAIAVAILLWARANLATTAEHERERAVRETLELARQSVLAGNSGVARAKLAEARTRGAADTTAFRFLEAMATQPTHGREATLQGHTALVNHVEVSPDRRDILTSSADGTARIWDVGTGTERRLLRGCGGLLLGASFDPTGHWIETECEDGIVRIYDRDGALHETLTTTRATPFARHVAFARFSGDGKQLATSLWGVLEVWDVGSGRRLWATGDDPQGRLAFTSDGKLVASLSTKDPVATLWAADTGKSVRTLRLADRNWGPVSTLFSEIAFDPSGARLVTVASDTELVQIWDVATGQLTGQLEGHAGKINQLQVSADGTRIALASREHAVQVWSVGSKTLERTLSVGNNQVLELAFDATGERIGAALTDGSVVIWNVASGVRIADLQGHSGAAWSLTFDRDRVVTAGADGTAITWNLVAAITLHAVPLGAPLLEFDARADRALVATTERVAVWSVPDAKLVAARSFGPNAIARFADDRTIGIADHEGRLWAWNVETGAARELARHAHGADRVVSDGHGTLVSVAGNEVLVAHVDRGGVLRWSAPANVGTVGFGPDGGVVVADEHSAIHVLDATGALVRVLHVDGHLKDIRVLPDGRMLTAGAHVVQLWSATGQLVYRFAHESSELIWLATDHAGARMATTGFDGTLRIWNLATLGLEAVVSRSSPVASLAFSADDQLLATLDVEGILQVWNPGTGEELFQRPTLHGVGLLELTDHGIVAADVTTLVTLPIQ